MIHSQEVDYWIADSKLDSRSWTLYYLSQKVIDHDGLSYVFIERYFQIRLESYSLAMHVDD